MDNMLQHNGFYINGNDIYADITEHAKKLFGENIVKKAIVFIDNCYSSNCEAKDYIDINIENLNTDLSRIFKYPCIDIDAGNIFIEFASGKILEICVSDFGKIKEFKGVW